MEYVKQGLSNWTNPSGRSSRAEYWSTFFAFNLVAFISIFISEALYGLLVIASLLIGIGLGIRRMHDAGVSGWFLIIPFANLIYSLSKSEPKENKWGPVPSESKTTSKKINTNKEKIENAEIGQSTTSKGDLVDDEIEALENRLSKLQELKKEKDSFREAEDKRKKIF